MRGLLCWRTFPAGPLTLPTLRECKGPPCEAGLVPRALCLGTRARSALRLQVGVGERVEGCTGPRVRGGNSAPWSLGVQWRSVSVAASLSCLLGGCYPSLATHIPPPPWSWALLPWLCTQV